MARFISQYRQYSLIGQTRSEMLLADGQKQLLRPGIVLDFQLGGSGGMGGLSPWEKQAALERFTFPGKGYDEDLTRRLSVFDTEAAQEIFEWSDETREAMENRLRAVHSNGIDFIEVEKPRVPAPFPHFDNLSDPDEIAAKIRDLGFDVGSVIQYETENRNRADVIAALEALSVETPEEPLIQA